MFYSYFLQVNGTSSELFDKSIVYAMDWFPRIVISKSVAYIINPIDALVSFCSRLVVTQNVNRHIDWAISHHFDEDLSDSVD